MKKGSAKGIKKKTLKVISGHDGHLLHPKGMADGSTIGTCFTPRASALPRAHPGRAKIAKNKTKTSNYEDFGSRLVQIDFRLGRSP